MTDIYLGEFGRSIFVDLQYDVSSATAIRILFSSSAGTFSATTSTLASNYTTSTGTIFSANKAIEYRVASGDFSATGVGDFRAWIQATFGTTAKLISSSFKFEVSTPGDP